MQRKVRPEDAQLGAAANIGFGLQHVLSMIGGVIAVPVIVGGAAGMDSGQTALLISCGLLISGLATLLQTVGAPKLGSQLPLVQGVSFASISTMLSIIAGNGENGFRVAIGASIVASAVALVLVPLFAQVIKLFPPVVTGSIITTIGLSLLPVAGRWITGPMTIAGAPNPDFGNIKSLAVGLVALLAVLRLSLTKTFTRLAILGGLLIGTLVAIPLGMVKYTPGNPYLAVPQPFAFGLPLFEMGAILSMLVVMIVIMVETTADIVAVGEVVDTYVGTRRVSAGLRADMLSSVIAPVFNSFPVTAFAQNVGLVAMSGVKSRWVVATGGGILAVLGLSPWLAGVFSMIPLPVLGGAGIALFGSVAASGIRSLGKVNYTGNSNLLIVAVSIGLGLLPSLAPGIWRAVPPQLAVVLDSGISTCAIVAIVLNMIFNRRGDSSKGGVAEAHAPEVGVVEEEELEDFSRVKPARAMHH